MNLGAHIIVAQRLVDDDPAYWLGAALPDLASMAGFRLLGSTANDRVTAGIAFHHRTDDAFHHHPWFMAIQLPLREALLDAGLARGPARAIAHVGPELLLDGSLVDPVTTPDAVATIDAAFAAVPHLRGELAPLVRTEHRERWGMHLDRVARWRPSEEDQGVEAVAHRLHRILQRRPRLAFPVDQIEEVTRQLETVNHHIEATSRTFVSDLVAGLRPA